MAAPTDAPPPSDEPPEHEGEPEPTVVETDPTGRYSRVSVFWGKGKPRSKKKTVAARKNSDPERLGAGGPRPLFVVLPPRVCVRER